MFNNIKNFFNLSQKMQAGPSISNYFLAVQVATHSLFQLIKVYIPSCNPLTRHQYMLLAGQVELQPTVQLIH